MKKKILAVALAAMTVLSGTALAFASEGSTTIVGPDAWAPVLAAMTGQISVTTIIGVLAACVGAAIGFVFMWWGVRKLLSTFFSGFRKGRASV